MITNDRVGRDHVLKLVGGLLAVHLLGHGIHLVSHAALSIVLSPVLTAGLALVVVVLPIAGFLLVWHGADRLGTAIFTGSMGISFLLPAVLHFAVSNPDHVASIPIGPWRVPFLVTAVLIAVADALGTVVGAALWRDLGRDYAEARPPTGRIEGVPDAGVRPFTRLTYWIARRWFGAVPAPLAVTAHHPRLLAGLNAYEVALAGADRVDDRLKELAVLKAAMVVGCEFCIDIGTAQATDLGITDAELRDLGEFETSDTFSARDRLVLRYAVAMTATPARVSDGLFDALAAEFNAAELVELTATIAFENYRARFNQAVDIDPQGFADGAYCPRPELDPETSPVPGVHGATDRSPMATEDS